MQILGQGRRRLRVTLHYEQWSKVTKSTVQSFFVPCSSYGTRDNGIKVQSCLVLR